MIGLLGLSEADWPGMTLKSLVIRYDTVMLNQWDQAATTHALLHNLTVTVANAVAGKTTQRPKQMTDFHPYRDNEANKVVVRDITVLRMIGDSMVRRKRA